MSDTDLQLLERYTRDRAEDAFAEIVRRHIGLVYSAALRQIRMPQLAEEVAQSTFTDLARQAEHLEPDTILTGWLYQVTRRTAIDVVRREARRQLREQIATEINAMNAADTDWVHIEPMLDEAMSTLDETDRVAILLRYFENQSLREVGETLGTSDDAAQKRVARAVERLRDFFTKHGVRAGASGLAAVISANSVQAAPVGLAVTISTAATLGKVGLTATAAKTIAMTTLQKTIVTVALSIAVGTALYEMRQASILSQRVQTLEQQPGIDGEHDRLTRERDEATRKIATLIAENERLNRNAGELLGLRGEVTRLREEAREMATTSPTMKALLKRVNLLKEKLDQMPDKKIPELQFLTEKDWADAAWDADLDTDDGVRLALSSLRNIATNTFLQLIRSALKKYIFDNDYNLPSNIVELKSYFDISVEDAMIQRYRLVQSGQLNKNLDASLVEKSVIVDPDYESTQSISMNGGSTRGINKIEEAVQKAVKAFANDNHYQLPSESSQLTEYLTKPIEAASVQKYLKKFTSYYPTPEEALLMPVLDAYAAVHDGRGPENISDLQPFLTTTEQQEAARKLEKRRQFKPEE